MPIPISKHTGLLIKSLDPVTEIYISLKNLLRVTENSILIGYGKGVSKYLLTASPASISCLLSDCNCPSTVRSHHETARVEVLICAF